MGMHGPLGSTWRRPASCDWSKEEQVRPVWPLFAPVFALADVTAGCCCGKLELIGASAKMSQVVTLGALTCFPCWYSAPVCQRRLPQPEWDRLYTAPLYFREQFLKPFFSPSPSSQYYVAFRNFSGVGRRPSSWKGVASAGASPPFYPSLFLSVLSLFSLLEGHT